MVYNLTVKVPIQYVLIELAADVTRPKLGNCAIINLGGGFNSAVVASLAFNLWTVGVMNAEVITTDLKLHHNIPDDEMVRFTDIGNTIPVRFDLNTSGGVSVTYDTSLLSPAMHGIYEKIYSIWHPDQMVIDDVK